jgi:hypothetical protein
VRANKLRQLRVALFNTLEQNFLGLAIGALNNADQWINTADIRRFRCDQHIGHFALQDGFDQADRVRIDPTHDANPPGDRSLGFILQGAKN